jgi:hypothetical protein
LELISSFRSVFVFVFVANWANEEEPPAAAAEEEEL